MMNDSTLSGTGLEVLQIVRSSIMLRWMVERHSDLLAVLKQAADRADRDPANRARYVPMTSVAGDFYDFIVADGKSAGLLIADFPGMEFPPC
jgi:hypothetical protein